MTAITKRKCNICARIRHFKPRPKKAVGLYCKSCANSIKCGGKGKVIPSKGKKKCFGCQKTKAVTKFHLYQKDNRYHTYCNDCKNSLYDKYRAENDWRLRRYNITEQQYNQLLQKQNNRCKV